MRAFKSAIQIVSATMAPVYTRMDPPFMAFYVRDMRRAATHYQLLGFRVLWTPRLDTVCLLLHGVNELHTSDTLVKIYLREDLNPPTPIRHVEGRSERGRVTIDLTPHVRNGLLDDIDLLHIHFARAAADNLGICRMPERPVEPHDGLKTLTSCDFNGV